MLIDQADQAIQGLLFPFQLRAQCNKYRESVEKHPPRKSDPDQQSLVRVNHSTVLVCLRNPSPRRRIQYLSQSLIHDHNA